MKNLIKKWLGLPAVDVIELPRPVYEIRYAEKFSDPLTLATHMLLQIRNLMYTKTRVVKFYFVGVDFGPVLNVLSYYIPSDKMQVETAGFMSNSDYSINNMIRSVTIFLSDVDESRFSTFCNTCKAKTP